jgi:transcriptional regulator with XRE-family HTH domain
MDKRQHEIDREFRDASGIPQKLIAQAIGCTAREMSQYEKYGVPLKKDIAENLRALYKNHNRAMTELASLWKQKQKGGKG